jgi:hypothetical protein
MEPYPKSIRESARSPGWTGLPGSSAERSVPWTATVDLFKTPTIFDRNRLRERFSKKGLDTSQRLRYKGDLAGQEFRKLFIFNMFHIFPSFSPECITWG